MSNKSEKFEQGTMFKTKTSPISEEHYYGNHPNPHLRNFAEKNSTEIDPKTPKELPPSQTVQKVGNIYELHSYWSKKPYFAIQRFIEHYSNKGALILDPFCGCGSTLQAAVSLGRNAIGIDLSPSACHISANTLLLADINNIESQANKIVCEVEKELSEIYSIKYEGKRWVISSLIHSDTIRCVKCLNYFSILETGTTNTRQQCPFCDEKFSTRSRKLEYGPDHIVAMELRKDLNSKRGKYVWLDDDSDLLKEINLTSEYTKKVDFTREQFQYPIPSRLIELGGRLMTTGTTTLGKLVDDRALLTLTALFSKINNVADYAMRNKLLLAFTSILKNCSKMYRYHEGGGGSPIGAYYIPPNRKELNPLFAFQDKIKTIIKATQEMFSWGQYNYCVSTQSAVELNMPSNSIDYVFTDPPYADTMPFGALNFIWDGWLSPDWNWMEKEAISENWGPVLLKTFKEVNRVLKPNAFCSVCYHDTSEGTWEELLDIMAEAGFKSVIGRDVLYIETTQRAYQQTVSSKVVKRDHVVNFQKASPASYVMNGLQLPEVSKNVIITDIIRDYLLESPGSTNDRIYDHLVNRLIMANKMHTYNFNELLMSIAVESQKGNNKWFLKESEYEVDIAETKIEDSAAENIKSFMTNWINRNPHYEGVHYSDIFEHYLYSIHEKPRRQLQDWLPDYFYRTTEGTYRLPANQEEEEAKAKGRLAGINRRIKRYVAYLTQGVPVPEKERPGDATLAEWIRQCKLTGLYLEGKTLFEKGGLDLNHLSEEAQVNVEEDYQVCLRLLTSGENVGKEKKSKK
jgi:DNA modification methylase